ncbi:MAG: 30S ribosomal protein S2, partial [Pseudomonadota bacterium]|nr:30S ribosomal protein S2 [Pseudomonadota bacterium]
YILLELEFLLYDLASSGFTNKEILNLTRERDKLELAIGGVKDMGGLPDLMIVIDTNKESIAIAEAHKLGIPVIAILDSNCNPDGITYPVPGNDDATRAIELYCSLFSGAVIDGIEQGAVSSGVDIGAQSEPTPEAALEATEEEVPEEDAPVEETFSEETPAEEASVEEAPAEEDATEKKAD